MLISARQYSVKLTVTYPKVSIPDVLYTIYMSIFVCGNIMNSYFAVKSQSMENSQNGTCAHSQSEKVQISLTQKVFEQL